MIQVIIADDSDLTLMGMLTLLGQHSEIRVLSSHQRLTDLLQALALRAPDIILLGDRLEPHLNPIVLLDQVRAAAPKAAVILTSHAPDGLIVHELLNRGAVGYLYKSDPLGEDLVQAIQTVVRGRLYLSPTVNAEYLLTVRSQPLGWQIDSEAHNILQLMAQGYRPQEIALIHGVPVRRIYWVGNKLRDRFGAETNEQLMVRATEEGFLI